MKKIRIFAILILLILLNAVSHSQGIRESGEDTIRTAEYGLQIWTATNLNVDHFRNGDIITEAKSEEEWTNAGKNGTPAWCYYENDPENGRIYGRLYNWYAISDKRGLAPEGWQIPANTDWRILVKNLKGVDVAGSKLKSRTAWKSKKGTDAIGFSAGPGGYRDSNGKFREFGTSGQWWSDSVPVDIKPSDKIYTVRLSDNSPEVKYLETDKGAGCSIRCKKDKEKDQVK